MSRFMLQWRPLYGIEVNGIIWLMESNWSRFTGPKLLFYLMWVSNSNSLAFCYHLASTKGSAIFGLFHFDLSIVSDFCYNGPKFTSMQQIYSTSQAENVQTLCKMVFSTHCKIFLSQWGSSNFILLQKGFRELFEGPKGFRIVKKVEKHCFRW